MKRKKWWMWPCHAPPIFSVVVVGKVLELGITEKCVFGCDG